MRLHDIEGGVLRGGPAVGVAENGLDADGNGDAGTPEQSTGRAPSGMTVCGMMRTKRLQRGGGFPLCKKAFVT